MKKAIPADAVLVPDAATCTFKGMIFDIYQWPQKLFDGSEHTFEMLKRADTVNVIAVVDEKILIIDDEQPHLGKRKSFPGGRVDDEDETILAAAQREMKEETGYKFANWRLIKVTQPYRKIEWFVYTLLAWKPTAKQQPHLDAGEKISVSHLSFNDLKTLVIDDIGYIGESRGIFKKINDLEQLMSVPEFIGKEVNR